MPIPTTDTLQIRLSPMISRALNDLPRSRASTSSAFWYSLRLTVNEKSVCPDAPMFCTIMSTSMFAAAIAPTML